MAQNKIVKKAKKTKQAQKKSLDINVGALIENFDSKLDLVVEGHRGLSNKIDGLGEEINERFNEVDYKFETVFDELHLIQNELKEKISRDEFLVLQKRVITLEKMIIER